MTESTNAVPRVHVDVCWTFNSFVLCSASKSRLVITLMSNFIVHEHIIIVSIGYSVCIVFLYRHYG